MFQGKVWKYLSKFFSEKIPIHLTLIDPDPQRQTAKEAAEIAKIAEEVGSNAIMIGGSTGTALVDETLKEISKAVSIPTIIFPGNVDALSPHANAVFFMSLLNSSNPYFLIGAQAISAFTVKRYQLEPISLAYLVVEPGATVGYVGQARLLPRDRPQLSATYALAAEYLGFKMVYLEAGSGANNSIPATMVKTVCSAVDIPIMVGGGIETPEQAKSLVIAGAKAIVQGTFVERSIQQDRGKQLEKVIKAMRD